jgi:hypothetical protein
MKNYYSRVCRLSNGNLRVRSSFLPSSNKTGAGYTLYRWTLLMEVCE